MFSALWSMHLVTFYETGTKHLDNTYRAQDLHVQYQTSHWIMTTCF